MHMANPTTAQQVAQAASAPERQATGRLPTSSGAGGAPSGAADPMAGVAPEPWEGLLPQVRRVAVQETTVLLTGETGTGKTRLAKLVHELSPRRGEPFLVVDCGALSPTLVESELFGHAKGAFTGADRDRAGKLAAAGEGTLLLDEVNSLPAGLQGKLLRAVDERTFEPVGSDSSRPVRARLVAACNKPLEAEVAAGRFRADLFYRLNVVGFFLPPLRAVPGAARALAGRFVAELAARGRPDVAGLSDCALAAVSAYGWPGNIRELRNALEAAVALCEGPRVTARDLPQPVRAAAPRLYVPAPAADRGALAGCGREAEVRRITEALATHRNNRTRAARELGISRVSLYKKLRIYGLMQTVP
jgi:two-component system, NtrC family, response regulator HydG